MSKLITSDVSQETASLALPAVEHAGKNPDRKKIKYNKVVLQKEIQ